MNFETTITIQDKGKPLGTIQQLTVAALNPSGISRTFITLQSNKDKVLREQEDN